jgi:RimJ/RimL family protein N-acetyltransferase
MGRHLPFFFAWTDEIMGDDGSETAYAHHAVIVTTERLLLRPRRPGEEIAMAALLANPAISPNLCATIPADHGKPLAIFDRLTGRLVGAADHGVTGLGSGIEVTLWIGEPDWGRGYATEAAHGLVDHAFRDESVAVVWCSNRVTNARARRVIEKCGFQFRGNGMVRLFRPRRLPDRALRPRPTQLVEPQVVGCRPSTRFARECRARNSSVSCQPSPADVLTFAGRQGQTQRSLARRAALAHIDGMLIQAGSERARAP